MSQQKLDEHMNVAIVGHVDHGKSTIIGRLLSDTGSLPEGKLERVKETCRRNSKPFEYSFLLDALKDEQAQGITIDAARVFFKTKKRKYIIIDTPGHIEFLKNVVTGASRAEAALLVIDAHEGIQENSKRYCYMLAMLGIKQIAVLINKLDLDNYSEEKFSQIKQDYDEFLAQLKIKPTAYIPISGKEGENLVSISQKMPWYKGYTVLDQLDLFESQKDPEDREFRMPVQDVYKFTRNGDNRRIIAGSVISGKISVGDDILFYPSNKRSTIKSIEGFNAPLQSSVGAGNSTGFTITDHLYLKRGETMIRADQPKPEITSRISANIFWLGHKPLEKQKEYIVKIGSQKIVMELEEVQTVIDASNLGQMKKDRVSRHEVAEVILKLKSPIVFDLPHVNVLTSRFVIVDEFEIWGGGIITQALKHATDDYRERLMIRNYKWERSMIDVDDRAEKYNQKSCLILITGDKAVGKKNFAKSLEKRLFQDGKFTYFLGIGSVLYGLGADIKLSDQNNHEEHMRRLSEIANIILDSGAILIVTATQLTQVDLDLIRETLVMPEKLIPIWFGDKVSTDIHVQYHIYNEGNMDKTVDYTKRKLQEHGIIFKP